MNPLLQLIQALLDARERAGRSPYDTIFGQPTAQAFDRALPFGQPTASPFARALPFGGANTGSALEAILELIGRRQGLQAVEQPPQINIAQPQIAQPQTPARFAGVEQPPIIRTAEPTLTPMEQPPQINVLQGLTAPTRPTRQPAFYDYLARR